MSILNALVQAPRAMVKGMYDTAKSIYQTGKKAINPPLTNMQDKQYKSWREDYAKRHQYKP